MKESRIPRGRECRTSAPPQFGQRNLSPELNRLQPLKTRLAPFAERLRTAGTSHLFQIPRLAEFNPFQRRIDAAQQAREYTAHTHFHAARYALPRQIADTLHPAYRVRNLLIDPLARFNTRADFASLPVVHPRAP